MNTGCGVRASRAPHIAMRCRAGEAIGCLERSTISVADLLAVWPLSPPFNLSGSAQRKNLDRLVVHSPEFAFEKNIDNVRQAAKDLNIACAVAVDRSHSIWDAFDNQYRSALYFVDTHGRIHSGCANVMAHQLDQPSLGSVHAIR
jgi:hypothetical protein